MHTKAVPEVLGVQEVLGVPEVSVVPAAVVLTLWPAQCHLSSGSSSEVAGIVHVVDDCPEAVPSHRRAADAILHCHAVTGV